MGMGLGKTATSLESFRILKEMGEAHAMLVAAPLRVCNLTWPNEIAKWQQFSRFRVANLRTKAGLRAFDAKEADIYLCNYEMLPALIRRFVDDGGHWPFDVVNFDELTRVKNPKSKRINEFRRSLNHIHRRWGLTGTPNPNSLLELFAQVRLLDDGKRFGPDFDSWKKKLFHPIDYHEYDWRPDVGTEDIIYGKLADLALTLLSSEFLDIPDTIVEDLEVPLPEEAREAYREMERELLLSMGDRGDIVAPNAAVLVNKLLQICGGAAYNEDGDAIELHTAKITATRQFVKDNPEPVLIAYNYRHELARLRAALPNAIAFEDAKSVSAQQDVERNWNAGRIPQLLTHPKSMAHGLNLQDGGRTVLWFSPTWSGEDYRQLNARLARRGQQQVTRVVRVLCPGTMDDAVIETQDTKEEGQRALLQALSNFRKLLAN